MELLPGFEMREVGRLLTARRLAAQGDDPSAAPGTGAARAAGADPHGRPAEPLGGNQGSSRAPGTEWRVQADSLGPRGRLAALAHPVRDLRDTMHRITYHAETALLAPGKAEPGQQRDSAWPALQGLFPSATNLQPDATRPVFPGTASHLVLRVAIVTAQPVRTTAIPATGPSGTPRACPGHPP